MTLQDKKSEPAYGTDVLRFWIASVEFWRDVALGSKILSQSAEALRKIRNTARFILGNASDSGEYDTQNPVPFEQMSIVWSQILLILKMLTDIVGRSLCFARAHAAGKQCLQMLHGTKFPSW